jgi:cation transporter-like permease
MSIRNIATVALVIVLGLVLGVLGLVAADLYTVGVLILTVGGVGGAVLVGEYLIRYFSSRPLVALGRVVAAERLGADPDWWAIRPDLDIS